MGHKGQPSAIRIDGEIAYVALTKGLEAVVDISDLGTVSGKRWHAAVGQYGHAYAATYQNGTAVAMHRMLLKTPAGLYVDHIDGDGLNNRRSNIRNCTARQNMANIVSNRRNRLGLKGVAAIGSRYHAKITTDKRTIHLGTYDTPGEASAAYRGAAIALWGEFAKN